MKCICFRGCCNFIVGQRLCRARGAHPGPIFQLKCSISAVLRLTYTLNTHIAHAFLSCVCYATGACS